MAPTLRPRHTRHRDHRRACRPASSGGHPLGGNPRVETHGAFPDVGRPLMVSRVTRATSFRVRLESEETDVKLLNRGLALAVVGAGLAAAPRIGAQAAPAAQAEPTASQPWRDRADGEVAVTRRRAPPARSASSASRATATCCPVRRGRLARRGRGQGRRLPRPSTPPSSAPAPASCRGRASRRRRSGWTVTYTAVLPGRRRLRRQLKAHVDRQRRPHRGERLRRPRPRRCHVDPRQRPRGRRARGRPRQGRPAAPASGDGRRPPASQADAATWWSTAPARPRARPARPSWPRRRGLQHHRARQQRPRHACSSTPARASRSTATRWWTTRSTGTLYDRYDPDNPTDTGRPTPGVEGRRPVPGHAQPGPAEHGQLLRRVLLDSSTTRSATTPTTTPVHR